MNALLQLATFDVALEAFDIPHRLPFALRQFVINEPRPSTSHWQMWLTGLADKLERLAVRLKSSAFSEEANAAARSLRECRIAIVEFFQLNESSESKLSELQTINAIQSGMAADWDASDNSQYWTYLEDRATQLLQPFLDRLEGLREAFPSELQPFFELCQLTWCIPGDLNEWCDQTSADSSQRHGRLLNVIRPELQRRLQQCVSCQPGLSVVAVSHLDVDPDRLVIELHDLRQAVLQRLVDLSSQAVEVGSGSDAVEGVPSRSSEDGTTSTSAAKEVGSRSRAVGSVPNGSGVVATATNAAAAAAAEQKKTEGKQEWTEVGEDRTQQTHNVTEHQNGKVPFTENDEGVIIYGIQVKITSDAKKLLMHLCESQRATSYIDLQDFVNAERKDPKNKQTNSDHEINNTGMRKLMSTVRKALRAAFIDDCSDPIKRSGAGRDIRFSLDRKWLASHVRKNGSSGNFVATEFEV
ncbi:MAG: hypothetical protein ACK50J_18885 [Planctomyces sp.]